MAARTASLDPRETAIATLLPALSDPAPRVLFGTAAVPGFFKGQTAAVKAAAEHCLREQWLEETGAKAGTGAKAKSLYRLTARGIEALLRCSPPLLALQSVDETLRGQRQLIQQLQNAVEQLVSPTRYQRLEQLLQSAVEKLSPPDVTHVMAAAQSPKPTPAAADASWREKLLQLAKQAGGAAQPQSLRDLFRELKKTHSGLDLGQFHEGVRALRDAGRIRLLPYTRAYAEIAGHREAMFLDGEVMYYVRCD
jgi:hypothetical protein